MKPIGLVTCYFHHNYGSMLQAYATEMIMQKLNLQYETIACKRPRDYMTENKYLYYLKKVLVCDWNMFLGKRRIAKVMSKNPLFKANSIKRHKAFEDFSINYFHTSKFCKNRKELESMANEYSAFLVGSDQLWRTDSVEHGYYTLEWVPDGIRKIAYSTSIGVKKIPWFQIRKNRRFMNRFDFVALREKSACDLYYQMTRKTAQVVLDPTLLFSGEEWCKIQKAEPLTNDNYIFVYLLGNNPNQREYITQLKKITGYKIVALQHLDDYIPSDEGFADEAPYIGPKEFLNYIKNASYVFTDSFHCTVFSVLYKKKFFTFNRFSESAKQSTNTRIDNLLSIVGLENRRWDVNIPISNCLVQDIDFKKVDCKLDILRKKSWDYLDLALRGLND